MIVASDTSPIRALAHVNCLRYLGHLFDTILMTPSVVGELENPKRPRFVPVQVSSLSFVQIRSAVDMQKVRGLCQRLDLAEAESLVMALEAGVDTVLIDEVSGRAEAAKLGLCCIGAVGILIDLRKMGLIDSLSSVLHDLKTGLGFFLSDQLVQDSLRRVGE